MATATTTWESTHADTALRAFAARLGGELIRPGDAEYDAARAVWNGAYDRRPALVVRAADTIDVIRAVTFARERGLAVAVRSGGHSMAGHGTIDGGLVIDLSTMKGLSVDPERRVARVQPGLTWGEYAGQAQAYGLATSSGDMGSVGVGGLALGGGIGWLVRKHGLTIDSLLSVDVVTADGRLLTASADENPELFWALRGGGGNFGVATSFELQLQPVGPVLGGAVFYPAAGAKDLLQAYGCLALEARDELTTMAIVMQAPPLPFIPAEQHGRLVVAILVCYAGDLEDGQRAVAPLRALGAPIADVIGPMPYPALFALTAEGAVKGQHHAVRSMYLQHLDEAVLDTLLDHSQRMTSPLGMVQLRVLGGAMARVPADATAFAHRDKPYMLTLVNGWQDAAHSERHHAWVEQLWTALRPHASGVYVNFLADEGEARIREAYSPDTYQRLAAAKKAYDPTNFFRLNQNIKPLA